MTELWRQSAWTGLGLASSGLLQWAIVAMLARITDPATLGSFSWAAAVTLPLFAFSHFGLRALMVNGLDGGAGLVAHVRLRLLTGAVAALAALPFGVHAIGIFAAVCMARVADSAFDACLGDYQRAHRMDRAGQAQLLLNAVSLAAFAAVLGVTRAALPALSAWAASRAVFVALHLRSSGGPAAGLHWNLVLRHGWPLAWGAAMALAASNLPRLLLGNQAGRRALGLYAAIASLELVGGLVVAALAQAAASPLAAAEPGQAQPLVNRLLGTAGVTGMLAVSVAAVAGQRVLAILFGPDYAAEAPALTILLGGAACSYLATMYLTALSARGVLRPQPWVHLAAVAVGLLVGPGLIRHHDVAGAAWTSLAVAGTQLSASGLIWVLSGRIK